MNQKDQQLIFLMLAAIRTMLGGFSVYFLIMWLYYGKLLGAPLGVLLLAMASAMLTLRFR